MKGKPSVLIIDDDPTHLRIYGWIIAAAGYEARPALVTATRIELPDSQVDLILMDYRLSDQITAVEAAQITRERYPGVPVVVLSDLYDLPADIAPYAQAFVRKGDPAKLVETLASFLAPSARHAGGEA